MITIIPAIDLIDGKCVRLAQGDYARAITYNADPLAQAQIFEAAGIQRLHMVDLDGAKKGAVVNLSVLERIATHTNLQIDFGGGIKTGTELRAVLDAGARCAALGSVVVKSPEVFAAWISEFGVDRFLIGADVRDEKIAVSGWLEQTEIPVLDFVRALVQKNVTQIFCTDIGSDGMLGGPAVGLYRNMIATVPGIQLIASGGVASVEDIRVLEQLGCAGVIIGKAFYEGKISLAEVQQFFTNENQRAC